MLEQLVGQLGFLSECRVWLSFPLASCGTVDSTLGGTVAHVSSDQQLSDLSRLRQLSTTSTPGSVGGWVASQAHDNLFSTSKFSFLFFPSSSFLFDTSH